MGAAFMTRLYLGLGKQHRVFHVNKLAAELLGYEIDSLSYLTVMAHGLSALV